MKRRFQPGKFATVLALVVIGTCSALGVWQIQRAEFKATYLENQATRSQQTFHSLAPLLSYTEPAGYTVRIKVMFDNEHSFLLDNRLHQGVAGYHVLTPAMTLNNQWVLVNRGWIPRGQHRDALPAVPLIPGLHTIDGQTYQYSAKTFVLAEDDVSKPHWPLRIQKVDIPTFSRLLGVELAPFEIRLSPEAQVETREQLVRHWPTAASMTPDRHHAYALQWFALAIAALVIFIIAGLRSPSDTQTHEQPRQ